MKVDNAGGVGHQFFPDIDALGGGLAVVWQDSRTDDCYSVQRPMGNTAEATACPDDNVVNTFVATSSNGGTSWSSIKVSDVGHQPQYEMFGARDVPFQGDYNWVAIADTNGAAAGGLEAYVDLDRQPRRRTGRRPPGDRAGRIRRRPVPDRSRHRRRSRRLQRAAIPVRRPVHGQQLRQFRRRRPEHLRQSGERAVAPSFRRLSTRGRQRCRPRWSSGCRPYHRGPWMSPPPAPTIELSDRVRAFLAEPNYATLATVGADGDTASGSDLVSLR